MGVSLINKIKYSKIFFNIYYYLGSFFLNILKWLVPTDDKLIVFNSFGGRKFDDSPRAIYELMIKDQRFNDYDIVWAFLDPEKHNIPTGRKIKSDTLKYFITLLRARIWITNSALERGLKFKGRHVFYLNTWHGTPIKKMGRDISSDNNSFTGKSGFFDSVDIMLAQGVYDRDIFSRVFNIPIYKFAITGLPRNDELTKKNNPETIKLIKKKLNIPENKRVILYAPTFREYEKDNNFNCIMTQPLDLDKWEKELSGEYILLLRAHYEVIKIMNVPESDFIRNVSDWSNLNELMVISDILISDYSSIFFDYSILGKPMFAYCYDYDIYTYNRGLYFDIRKELESKGSISVEDIIEELKKGDFIKRSKFSVLFRSKYITAYGDSSSKALDLIADNLNRN